MIIASLFGEIEDGDGGITLLPSDGCVVLVTSCVVVDVAEIPVRCRVRGRQSNLNIVFIVTIVALKSNKLQLAIKGACYNGAAILVSPDGAGTASRHRRYTACLLFLTCKAVRSNLVGCEPKGIGGDPDK